MTEKYKVFDGHNDLLLRLWLKNDNQGKTFLESTRVTREGGHLDLESARTGNFAGGFFAIFVPSSEEMLSNNKVDFHKAKIAAEEMIEIAKKMEKQNPSNFAIIENSQQAIDTINQGKIACMLHFEGAEMIEKNLSNLDYFFSLGIRSIGPVWSRSNHFGHGVPFGFPGPPNQGPGLTEAGKNLVRECENAGILIDLSHLNEAGFWDIAKISGRPLMATHSNVHKLCNSPRNLSDEQLAAIRDTNGIVGLNFATGFLRKDGKNNENTKQEMIIQLEYLLNSLGEENVALGSDFDGAAMPGFIKNCAGLPNFTSLMRKNGFSEELVRKICLENWLNFLKRHF